jgi:hypothetical protein
LARSWSSFFLDGQPLLQHDPALQDGLHQQRRAVNLLGQIAVEDDSIATRIVEGDIADAHGGALDEFDTLGRVRPLHE